MEIIEQIKNLPDGARLLECQCAEVQDGKDVFWANGAKLKKLVDNYEQVKAALAALVAAARPVEDEINEVGSVAIGTFERFQAALAAAKSLLPAGGEDGTTD